MKIKKLLLGLLFCIFLGSLFGCGDYAVSLPGGYSLVRIYGGAILISHSSKGVVINANIDSYKVLDELIVGHVTVAELPPEKDYSKPGYFIINTKTHEVGEGLDRMAWLEALRKINIVTEPKLSKPSRFDKDYLK
jgi:hypothetical protein